MANDYTLPFLSDLPQQFSNNDVEQIWRNRAYKAQIPKLKGIRGPVRGINGQGFL